MTLVESGQSLKQMVAKKLQKHYRELQKHPNKAASCFVGFDGFTDEIISAVHTRLNPKEYHPFETIIDFSSRLADAAGKSCNIELIVKQTKIGGNAPILTDALLQGGHSIIFAGNIGSEGFIEPLFQPMASLCQAVVPMGPSAHSDAIEFHDGKIILGKLDCLTHINYENLIKQVGKEQLILWLDQTDLFACVNWTMLSAMTELWERLATDIIPSFHKRERVLFVDLADPAKRTDADIRAAMKTLAKLSDSYKVILGLNEAEALRLASVYNLAFKGSGEPAVMLLAKELREVLGFSEVVLHATSFAVVATEKGSWFVAGPYCAKPFLTTGAGDNFNAGYCNGYLYGLSAKEALLSGVATSGYYVRKGKSPTMDELVDFIKQWDLDPYSLDKIQDNATC